MKTKRGAPKKSPDKAKAERIPIRVSNAEKEAFQAAAELDGKTTSDWIRDRLRRLARQELEQAGKPVAFLI
jgi:uncharacterized protein (DUF1778 family)